MPEVAAGASSVQARLESLRARGAARVAPARWCLLESIARRAATHAGGARAVLEARLATLASELEARLERTAAALAEAPQQAAPTAAATGPLGELARSLGRRVDRPADAPGAVAASSPAAFAQPPSPVPAETLQFLRRTWSRLSADQRLAQSQAALPENAGPLNSQQLVHRALSTMRELSPAYFEQFMSYVDALLWLELANAGGFETSPAPAPAPARAPAAAARRSAPPRSGGAATD